jgi:hypothetical protein
MRYSDGRPPCGHKYCPEQKCMYSGPPILDIPFAEIELRILKFCAEESEAVRSFPKRDESSDDRVTRDAPSERPKSILTILNRSPNRDSSASLDDRAHEFSQGVAIHMPSGEDLCSFCYQTRGAHAGFPPQP